MSVFCLVECQCSVWWNVSVLSGWNVSVLSGWNVSVLSGGMSVFCLGGMSVFCLGGIAFVWAWVGMSYVWVSQRRIEISINVTSRLY